MKLKVLTTSDKTDHPGWHKLKASLEKFGYDYEHILHPFAFGHQLPVIRDWCDKYSGDSSHILYTDAFDTIAFSGADEVCTKFPECKMLISGEKNCYPLWERAKEYPEVNSPWKYVNGGGWMVAIDYFKELCKKENLTESSHDQVWLMDAFLRNQGDIKIDTNCEIFQTIAFSHKEEWQLSREIISHISTETEFKEEMETRFINLGTGTRPVFFHGNGHTEMDWLW